jgi:2-C-methyl-D-erythritol 4-phosphate cytidylyltransferase
MRITAMVLALGGGRGTFAPAWATLAGQPICAWSLAALAAVPEIDEMTLVVAKARRDQATALLDRGGWNTVRIMAIAPGATALSEQVRLAWASRTRTRDAVLLHDGARPLLSPALTRALVRQASDQHIIAAAVPMKETLKWVDERRHVRETPPRAALWQLLTPVVLPVAALSELLDAPPNRKTAPTVTASSSLARWVAAGTTYPMHLLAAGHDDTLVRRRADLAVLTEMLRG